MFGRCLSMFASLYMVLAMSPAVAIGQPAVKGTWGPPFDWPNVGIHVHVLPNGKVLFWPRRELGETLDSHFSVPRVWDPETGLFTRTPQPTAISGERFNLFCAGHTFLPDGRLLVAGGHFADSIGVKHATIYDSCANTWTPIDDMDVGNNQGGRWYPTVVTLPNGNVLVSSGSDQQKNVNPIQQIGEVGHWRNIVGFNGLPLYPRMHVAPDGRVFMSGLINEGGNDQFQGSFLLDTNANGGQGQWTRLDAAHRGPQRDYYPSVMYDVGKIMVVGGGNPPLKSTEIIDLTKNPPQWKAADDMSIGRRQHNATILPDGTILVTGGTSGNGFNDLTKPVFVAELWDPNKPATEQWTQLAQESIPRLYHSTAVLLPDGRVLSTGGGEYRPTNAPNDAKDNHANAQIFSPPYLFSGARPDISSAPDSVTYGSTFDVGTSDPKAISDVNWIRLSSVTHSFNQNQRINFLKFTRNSTKLTVTAPTKAELCPPGHYMLFLLKTVGDQKVPSIAKIIRID